MLEGSDIAQKTALKKEDAAPAGMRRRRIAIVATAVLALGAFIVNTADLSPFIKTNGTIDHNFQFTPKMNMAKLPPKFSYYGDLREGLIPVNSSHEQLGSGFADERGRVLIGPKFETVMNFSEGLAGVKMPGSPAKWGFIDHTGQVVIQTRYLEIDSFHNGFARVLTDRPQIIDKNGNVVRFAGNDVTYCVSGGFQIVQNPAKQLFGLAKGRELLIPCQYDDVAEVTTAETPKCFESDDRHPVIAACGDNRDAQFPFFKLRQNGLYGLADGNGKVCFPVRFDDILNVHNGHALIKQDNVFGFSDLIGKLVIAPKFDEVTRYDDLIAVRSGENVHLVDPAGKLVKGAAIDNIVCDSKTFQWLHDGLGLFKRNGLYGFVDNRGREVIAPKYKSAHQFKDGLARVLEDSRWFFIDKDGNKENKTGYVRTLQFHSGVAEVTVAGPLYGVMEETPGQPVFIKAVAELGPIARPKKFETEELDAKANHVWADWGY